MQMNETITISLVSQSLGVQMEEHHDNVIMTKKYVGMSGDSWVCEEIMQANIPLGARLSFINGTKITTLEQAGHLLQTLPRPVSICFEFL